MANIKEVAKRAGVGVGTVSRVLNGSGYVSEDTRMKVERAVAELGYKPNELARNLFRNRSGIIGVIVPDVDHPFYASFVRNTEINAYRYGYKTMVCNAVGVSTREQEYLNMLERNIVDGLITASHSLDDDEYLKVKRPIISLDRDFFGDIPRVGSDHRKIGVMAAKELLRCGCKNVIQFTASSLPHNKSYERNQSFVDHLLSNGVRVTTVESAWNEFSFSYFDQIMQEYIGDYPKIDGIFTTDMPAICAMNAAVAKGRRVPRDLKIVAVDGTTATRLVRPIITAIVQNVPEISRLCVESLLELIEGEKNVPDVQTVDVEMQFGGTTCPP